MTFRLGTVSKILWHFTGGPLWDDYRVSSMTASVVEKVGLKEVVLGL